MKLVLVCFYEAYPPESGAASVTFNVAKYASGERFLIQLGTEDRREVTKDGVAVITLAGAYDNRYQKVKSLPGRIGRIVEVLRNVSPDMIVLEGASWVFYHWLLFRKIRQAFPTARIIYHSHNVEYNLRKEKHGAVVTMLTRLAEGAILRNADLSSAVSEVDSEQFEKLYGVRAQILPNGVDCEMFDHVPETDIMAAKSKYGIRDKTVLFMGSYLYKPNREAIDFLVEAVMPQVVERCNDTQLVIIGGEAPYNMPWLLNPGCIHHEDVPAFARACRVGVAPIFSGSGTRLKILEYMAAGVPVVSTAKGMEGLELVSGRDVLVAEDAAKFAAEICRLLSDEKLSASLSKRGRAIVTARYAWKTIMQDFNKVLGV